MTRIFLGRTGEKNERYEKGENQRGHLPIVKGEHF